MANTFKTTKLVAQLVGLELYNQLRLAKLVRRYGADVWQAPAAGALGPTVDFPMPVRYQAARGPGINRQAITERTQPVTLDQDFNIALDMAVFDATLNTKAEITVATSKYIKPAVKTLANEIDDYLAGLALKLHQTAGTAATTPGTEATTAANLQVMAKIEQIMTENGVADNEQKMIILDPKAAGYFPASLVGLFTSESQKAMTSGRIGHAMGFDFYRSGNIRKHTSGFIAAGALSNGLVAQEGDTINIDTLTGTTDELVVGDTISFAGVYAVNPVSKRTVSSGRTMEFIVTEAVAEAGSAMAVKISPAIVTSGAYQNVSNGVADGVAVTIKATHTANMAIIQDTLCLATMPFKLPKSAVIAEPINYEGLSMMMTAAYDVDLRQETCRVDVLFGGRELYPETGVRLLG